MFKKTNNDNKERKDLLLKSEENRINENPNPPAMLGGWEES